MRRPDSPTGELLLVFGLVFGCMQVAELVGVVDRAAAWVALVAPIERPWTLVTSVYAHLGVRHLVTNALALALVGFPLERATSRFRFHAFVLLTGVLAGLSELFASDLVGPPVAVLGASGAILALYGYVLAGNPLTGGLLARLELGRRATVVLVLAAAVAVVVLTAGPGVAVVAHATGFVLGLVGGRWHVLRVGRPDRPELAIPGRS